MSDETFKTEGLRYEHRGIEYDVLHNLWRTSPADEWNRTKWYYAIVIPEEFGIDTLETSGQIYWTVSGAQRDAKKRVDEILARRKNPEDVRKLRNRLLRLTS